MPRILLGGVPFGLNNVGDEAILACTVQILREVCSQAAITVATNDPETAPRLKVEVAPLRGFMPPKRTPPDEWDRIAGDIRAHDVFVWAGATGLSDYPEIPTRMLRIAKDAGKTAIVWCVGMNDELNPIKYRVQAGPRRRVLESLSALSMGLFDAVAIEEGRREARARRQIATELNRADLLVVRDPETRDELERCGVGNEIVVGADSALVLKPAKLAAVSMPEDVQHALKATGPKIGVCISAQRAPANENDMIALLDRILDRNDARIVFVPMNPETDATLMSGFMERLRYRDRAVVLTGRYEPEEILAVVADLDVIISSRLHLIIFAAIQHRPFIGIGRGSKVANFLRPYQLEPAGSVEDCDFDHVEKEVTRLLREGPAFETTSHKVRTKLLARLEDAKSRLKDLLSP